MLSHRLRRVISAVPSYLQRSISLSRASGLSSISSLLPRSVVEQSTKFSRSPGKLFSTTQYQYDPYTGEDSFTPDNEGCDFNHWLITMNFPKDNLPSREEMVSIFEQTCAKGLGISLEEAKKKIYAICTTSYQGFQAKMTVGEVEKFRELAGVQYIIPDSYVDVENKVYGGDRYENGVITPGPIPAPTREGFDSVAKESLPVQEEDQESQTTPCQGSTSEQVEYQGNQMPLAQRSFKQTQGTLALGQGQGQSSRMSIQGQEQDQESHLPPSQGSASEQVEDQGSQMLPGRRSFKQTQGTLALGQGQHRGQGSRMSIPGQGQHRGHGSKMPSFQGSFKQSQGTSFVGQGQAQRSQIPSFKSSFKQGQGTPIHRQGQAQGSQMPLNQGRFEQGQETPTLRQGQAQGDNNQSQGTPIHGQGQGQGSQIPSYQLGYSQGQGTQMSPYQGLPSNYGQGAFVHYNQGQPQGNFVQGTQENYTPLSSGNYGPPQGQPHGYPGHRQDQGGQLFSPYQGTYNQGQGQIPSYRMSYNQGLGALVPSYQGTPGNYGQWAFVNYNQGPPHGNFLHGPQQNYNQEGQWSYRPVNGGHYGPTQFGIRYPGPPQSQGNQMPQYQLSYNEVQGNPFPGQCRCQACGMPYNQGQGTQIPGQWQGQGCTLPSYQVSYNQGQGAPASTYQGTPGSYGQGAFVNYNQGFPVNQVNHNMQNGGNYGLVHGSAGNPRFRQGYPGHGQSQTFQQESQRNDPAAGERSNNDLADQTETRKLISRT